MVNSKKLKLITEKYKSIFISNEFVNQNIITGENTIYMNNEAIEIVQEIKYLGTIVERNLKFN